MSDKQTARTVVLLMVSGGSDSMALLELACTHAGEGEIKGEFKSELISHFECEINSDLNSPLISPGLTSPADMPLRAMIAAMLPAPGECALHVLHVNHLLRGEASDGDEAFVVARCEELGVPCEVARVDIATLAREGKGGMEAVAREERYRLAQATLEAACVRENATSGIICTAHTLDDRIETFYMRSLVGTGPGGLASIPRSRGNLRRPLLSATREQLRDWLRARHPGVPDEKLWREDETNLSGDNFRSKLRISLMPVLRELRPGFEGPLEQTMDLIADEDDALSQEADSIVYRSLGWDGKTARIPVSVLQSASRPLARRVLRACLLVVNPGARLEAAHIDCVLAGMEEAGFAIDVPGAIRVTSNGAALHMRKLQGN